MKKILFVLLILLQCVGINRKSEKLNIELLIGKWQWVESIGGIGGLHHTPESQGYSKTIEFTESSEYFEYKNDSLEILGCYSYIKQENILVLRTQAYMTFSILLADDTLKLFQTNIYDGYNHIYVRMRN